MTQHVRREIYLFCLPYPYLLVFPMVHERRPCHSFIVFAFNEQMTTTGQDVLVDVPLTENIRRFGKQIFKLIHSSQLPIGDDNLW
jgi:hypothetical protein